MISFFFNLAVSFGKIKVSGFVVVSSFLGSLWCGIQIITTYETLV